MIAKVRRVLFLRCRFSCFACAVIPWSSRRCCIDTPNVIASDQRERGNLENNKFHSIFCYFFSGLPRRDYVPPRNDGAFLQGFRSMQQRRLDPLLYERLNKEVKILSFRGYDHGIRLIIS
ncbi:MULTISPECIES: hypothetical protein [unclassified Rickettsia]|uniref:hypothetical protein n=1 Tax=unclassified Rickettsia TaxID=114295 RepID=UPI003133439C